MVNGRVDYGDKSSHKNFGAGRPRFYATSYLKFEAKYILP